MAKNKLSRKRPAVVLSLNESAEDFQESSSGKPACRPPAEKRPLVEAAAETSERDVVLDCPLCGKGFKAGQSLATRSAHLKACANKKGISTDKLLQIRQLEERQAAEREALGLSRIASSKAKADLDQTTKQTKPKPAPRAQHQKSVIVAETVDPQLEMAIALSASLAHEKSCQEIEERKRLESLGISDPGASTSKMPSGGVSSSPVRPDPAVLVSQAAKWEEILPRHSERAKLPARKMAKTALEVRTDAERERQISEKVVAVLARTIEPAATCNRVMPVAGCRLRKNVCAESVLWRSAGQNKPLHEYNTSLLVPFTEQQPSSSSCAEKSLSVTASKVDGPESNNTNLRINALERLSADLLAFLTEGKHSDTVVYCKDGASLKCHSTIMLARCPMLFREASTEHGEDDKCQYILCWNHLTKGAVQVFLQYLYSGRLNEPKSYNDYKALLEYARQYRLTEMEKCLKAINVFTLAANSSQSDTETETEVRSRGEPETEPQTGGEVGDSEEVDYGEEALVGATQKIDILLKELDCSEQELSKSVEESDAEDSCSPIKHSACINPDNSVIERPENDPCGDSDEDMFGDSRIELLPNMTSPPAPSLANPANGSKELSQKVGCSDADHFDSVPGVWDNYYDEPDPIDDLPQISQTSTPRKTSPFPATSKETDDPIRPVASLSPSKASQPSSLKPLRTPAKSSVVNRAITPLPDYESMLSPALRKELKRFGLKAIPRRKAVQILQHIYEEMHPVVEENIGDTAELDNVSMTCSQESSQSSLASEKNYGHPNEEQPLIEMSFDSDEDDNDDPNPVTQTASTKPLDQRIRAFIKDNAALHEKILTFEPIWLEDFCTEFKSVTKTRCKMSQVMDILDSECIVFRTRGRKRPTHSQKRSQKR